MSSDISEVQNNSGSYGNNALLVLLFFIAIFLCLRLCWLYLASPQRFPINTVKIAATYRHITHKQLEEVLSKHLTCSFFALSVSKLQHALKDIDWADKVSVEKIWPDALKITLKEKSPVAVFGNAYMMGNGELFHQGKASYDVRLPILNGPIKQKTEVLQVYQKLSKILNKYGLRLASLTLRDNQAWELTLANGTAVFLGKRDIELRLDRFCKAFPRIVAEKAVSPARVDLRYPKAMAVRWTQ